MIGDIIDSGGGTLVASYQMAGDVGAVVGPVAAGFLVDSASYAAAFGLAGPRTVSLLAWALHLNWPWMSCSAWRGP
jgi:MFS family permease